MNFYNNCDHEEADTRIFNHIYLCVKEGWTKFNIRTGDTDVVVLAVNVCAGLETIEELNIHFGTGKHFKNFDAVLISALFFIRRGHGKLIESPTTSAGKKTKMMVLMMS